MSLKNTGFTSPTNPRLDVVNVIPMEVGGETLKATTGNSDLLISIPQFAQNWRLESVTVIGATTLATNNTNYVTWTITNLGTAGSGTTVMLGTNNTTVTTGSAWTANVSRALTVTSTFADLKVAAGETLRIRCAATGTLANTVANVGYTLTFVETTFK